MVIDKKIQVLICIFFLAKSFCFSQSTDNENLMLKEFFDEKINSALSSVRAKDSVIMSNNVIVHKHIDFKTGADDMAEVVAPVMDAQLELYETTKDKGYLINFINDAIQMMSMRADYMQNRLGTYNALGLITYPSNYTSSTPPPLWSWVNWQEDGEDDKDFPLIASPGTTRPYVYEDAYICKVLAHFIYIVKKDLVLNSSTIPANTIPYKDVLFPNAPMQTYGQVADWLYLRVFETFSYLNTNYWDTNLLSPDRYNVIQMNKQAQFGMALAYLSKTYNIAYYNDKLASLLNLFTSNFILWNNCTTCKSPGVECYSSIDTLLCDRENHFHQQILSTTSIRKVFHHDENDNTYFWNHNGWNDVRCENLPVGNYGEDMSHAQASLMFPKISHELGFSAFTSIDMQRFNNTFAKKIFHDNMPAANTGTQWGFHSSISGTDIYFGDNCKDNIGVFNVFGNPRAYNYMVFDKYTDGSPAKSTYDILMDDVRWFYPYSPVNSSFLKGNLTGLDYLGFANIVKRQWEKECTNLSLYNRVVNYHQDFWAKNKLEIAPDKKPTDYPTNSYTYPIIAEQSFTIKSGVVSNIFAAEEITFSGEVHFEAGSEVHAFINPTPCGPNGNRMAYSEPAEQDSIAVLQQQVDAQMQANVDAVNLLAAQLIQQKQDSLLKQQVLLNNIETTTLLTYNPTLITIYPNPNNGEFVLELSNAPKGNYTLQITDAVGRSVMQQNYIVQEQNLKQNINLQAQGKGIYFVKINSEQINEVRKVVVE